MTNVMQLRANRQHALNAWLSGSDMSDSNDSRFPRWAGDDGRAISMVDFHFWTQSQKDAEAAHFSELDAIYEIEKSKL